MIQLPGTIVNCICSIKIKGILLGLFLGLRRISCLTTCTGSIGKTGDAVLTEASADTLSVTANIHWHITLCQYNAKNVPIVMNTRI